MEREDIRSMTPAELETRLASLGLPRFRAEQIFGWVHREIGDFSEMSNIPKSVRAILEDNFDLRGIFVEKRLESRYDDTVKYLYRLCDGETVETVLMHYRHGYSVCISSQVGCRMGCGFCASTIGGLIRNLTASEMLAQITAAQHDRGVRVSNIVLMGMGEPLDNFDAVMRFLELAGNPQALGVGMRHISLSTCGRVDGIYRLLERGLQLTLSISLHAPNDEIRSRLMPVNRKWGVGELLAACRAYTEATHRRISFEYALIGGVNDSDDCALELAARLKGMLCHVNLIPVNEVRENSFVRSSRQRVRRFQQLLTERGLNATVRRTLGADISASCGQLRRAAASADDPGGEGGKKPNQSERLETCP